MIERALDHILHRRYGRNIRLIASRGVHQIDHVFGRIDMRESDISIDIRVGMPGHVAFLGIALVD